MGQNHMGPPEALVLALHGRLGFDDFIETGTYRGDTAAWAAGHFARVTTIELSPAFHAAAQARFLAQPAVRCLVGDSPTALREIVSALAGPALFWLDAHWSGLDTAGRDAECPLLAEIAVINAVPRTHTVLVDDARLFCAPPPPPHRAEQWPDLHTTLAALRDQGRRHVVMCGDVFVAVPAGERGFLNGWLQYQARTVLSAGWLARWWERIRA